MVDYGESPSGKAGSIEVTVAEALSVLNGGVISSSTNTKGDAGLVRVKAGSIMIDGQGSSDYTGIFDEAVSGSTGNAGSIELTATGKLSVVNGGQISSSTFGAGDAGSVKVNAGSILIDGQGTGAGIVVRAEYGSTGNAGNIEVTAAGSLSIVSGGEISSSTSASGSAGGIKVSAGNISIEGQGAGGAASIHSDTYYGSGNAGNVEVATTGNLLIAGGAYISSETWSTLGNAGAIKVNAGSLTIDGNGSSNATGLFSQAEAGSKGRAGEIEVTVTRNLSIFNGGEITSSTWSSKNANSIRISAGSIDIDGQESRFSTTGILSKTNSGTGNAGSVEVATIGGLSITNGGVISSGTSASGNAGSVKVSADNFSII
jgi:large exoprotein involved in heme utilization and adhesion